jgi:hypothetical protein
LFAVHGTSSRELMSKGIVKIDSRAARLSNISAAREPQYYGEWWKKRRE